MNFAEYMELDESVLGDRVTQWLVDFARSTMQASKSQYQDTLHAVTILRQQLNSILGSPKPTEDQMRLALRAIKDLPKIGAVVVGLVAPVPGVFTALMILAVAFKRAFGISILPTHFDNAYLSQNTWMGRMAAKREWNLTDYHPEDHAAIEQILTSVDKMYPVAGPIVGGLTVLQEVPNQASIGASVSDYQILPKIREFPLHGFGGASSYYAANDQQHCLALAKQIAASRQISPVIMVEEKAGPYVLEGGHRVSALIELKIMVVPAMIVVDIDSYF